jgi:hypothetical protein
MQPVMAGTSIRDYRVYVERVKRVIENVSRFLLIFLNYDVFDGLRGKQDETASVMKE